MMPKLFAWFIVFLCTTALSCWTLESFPTLKSPDFNLSGYVVQGQEIHVSRHAGPNRTVRLESKGDKEEYEKHYEVSVSKKAKSGTGAYGGGNIAHRPRQGRNAAPSPLVSRPPWFLATVVLHAILTFILVFPDLLLKLF